MNGFQKVGLGVGIGSLVVVCLVAYLWWSSPVISFGATSQRNVSTQEARIQGEFRGSSQTGFASGAAPGASAAPSGASPLNSTATYPQGMPALPQVPAPLFGRGGASEGGGARPPSSTDMALSAIAIGKNGAPSLNLIQQRLQALVADGRQPTPSEVDLVLADLQKNQGSNVVAGVDLQVMRDNLAHTNRIAKIAKEIQGIAANPAKGDELRIAALVAEMQRRQGAMASPMVAQGQR